MIRVSNSLITHLNVNLVILKIDVQSYKDMGKLTLEIRVELKN